MKFFIITATLVFSMGLFAQDESTSQSLIEHLKAGDKTAAKVDVDKLFKKDGLIQDQEKSFYTLINKIIDNNLKVGEGCDAARVALHDLFLVEFTAVMDIPLIKRNEDVFFGSEFRKNLLQAIAKCNFNQCTDDNQKKVILDDLASIKTNFYSDHVGGNGKSRAWALLGATYDELSKAKN